LKVLCHNAFWFQGYPFPDELPSDADAEILESLCSIYADLNPDIICLQEVQSQEVFQGIRERLGMSGCYCPGGGLHQYGGAVLWRDSSARPVIDSRNSGAGTQRMYQIVETQGWGLPMQICNVHLPSQRQLGPRLAAEKRLSELLEVIEFGPDLIAGDFNERDGLDLGKCLRRRGYIDSASTSGHSDLPTGLGGGRGDYIWLKGYLRHHLLEYGVVGKERLEFDGPGKLYLSDHLPLWVVLSCRSRQRRSGSIQILAQSGLNIAP
jgi:endonuclease/exonuclease/phosphatase family metal-dependent hydrolase